MEPAPFAILRVAKLKTMGNVGGSLAHNYRTQSTPNADPDRAALNKHQRTKDEVEARIRSLIPEKRRKDAVLGLEYFIGASPEWFDKADRKQQNAYFDSALDWLEKLHGKANVVSWSIHRDETSPHLVVYVVPLVDGTLNAKQFTGGKKVLGEMQTSFATDVGQQHGMRRGVERSQAEHQSVAQYYQHVNRTLGQLEELTLIDKASIGIGKPTKRAQEAISNGEAIVAKAAAYDASEARRKAQEASLARRGADLDRRESVLAAQEPLIGQLEHEVAALREEKRVLEFRLAKTEESAKGYERGRDAAIDELRELRDRTLGLDR